MTETPHGSRFGDWDAFAELRRHIDDERPDCILMVGDHELRSGILATGTMGDRPMKPVWHGTSLRSAGFRVFGSGR